MKYNLFLFDLDDTLLDFKASEKKSFQLVLQGLGVTTGLDELFARYLVENAALWKLFEEAKTTKDHLKVERFRRVFKAHQVDLNPELASARYLETLPETVVLIDYAAELCEWVARHGEIGIITNGIQSVQMERISRSKLAPYISFVSVSDECGYAKPDARFFEYTVKKARAFTKASSIIIGDREDADLQGALNFGIDSCWFNPDRRPLPGHLRPTFTMEHLSELPALLERSYTHRT